MPHHHDLPKGLGSQDIEGQMTDEPLSIPLWRTVGPNEDEFEMGDRVIYKRPEWDPKLSWGDRHGAIAGWTMEAKSHNVQSLIPERLYWVRWDGLHGCVETGYRKRMLQREEK
jgi:hypothetical protein